MLSGCEQVELTLGTALCHQKEKIRHVYFPTDSFISLVTSAGDSALEVGLVGNEGMLGMALVLGVDESPLEGLVQGAGRAWRMETRALMRELKRSPALRRELNRYVYVTLTQFAQSAACTRYHLVEARLAHWLLMTRDRAHADHFAVTHAFMAYMLGVRRAGVTRAAKSLQWRHLIAYRRGKVRVLDRRGLEAASCSCYRAGKDAYKRVMTAARPRTRAATRKSARRT